MDKPHSSHKSIIVWLLSISFLVFIMVFVGGVTRLTNSGLSIVEWKPVTGIIPPLSEEAWEEEFSKYQNYPEFKLINHQMALHEFKGIYFWEYLHRLLGRLIGMVFFFPYLYFLIKKRIDKSLNKKLLFTFFLGGLQGFMGWYMVMSGLVDKPDVSHFRLASHLLLAFIIIAYIFWIIFGLVYQGEKSKAKGRIYFSWALMLLIFLQIMYGAFTAGLNAGLGYNTFPLMDGKLLPDAMFYLDPAWLNFFENNASIQFVHRTLGWIVLFSVGAFAIKYKNHSEKRQKTAINLMVVTVIVQFLLGVSTLLLHVPLSLASLHQLGALVLCIASVFNLYVSCRAKTEA